MDEQIHCIRQAIAKLNDETETGQWLTVLDMIATISRQATGPAVLGKPVSFASATDQAAFLAHLEEDDAKSEESKNFLLSDWKRHARQSGTLALVCSTDNLTFERSRLVGRIQQDPTLSTNIRRAKLAEAKEYWLARGKRYGDWHCVNVLLLECQLFVYDPDYSLANGSVAQAARATYRRRIRSYPGMSLVQDIWRSTNPRIDKVFVSGGGNPGRECVSLSLRFMLDMVEKATTSEDWTPNPQDGWEVLAR